MENELKKGESGSRETSSGGYCGPGKIDLDQEVKVQMTRSVWILNILSGKSR